MNSLLVLTTLYPNSVKPRHGIFIETRLKKLIGSGLCQADVIAPVPWFPFKLKALLVIQIFKRSHLSKCIMASMCIIRVILLYPKSACI